jgi:hypothetical protein
LVESEMAKVWLSKASRGNTIVDQLTHDPKIEGSNPASSSRIDKWQKLGQAWPVEVAQW